jgi:hypothetical protein
MNRQWLFLTERKGGEQWIARLGWRATNLLPQGIVGQQVNRLHCACDTHIPKGGYPVPETILLRSARSPAGPGNVPSRGREPEHGDEPWSEAKNQRRCDLIDRKYAVGLTPPEAIELTQLQEQMLRHRQRVAPLPSA